MTPNVFRRQIRLVDPFNQDDPAVIEVLKDGRMSFECSEDCARELWRIAAAEEIDYAALVRQLVDLIIQERAEWKAAQRNIVKFPFIDGLDVKDSAERPACRERE